MHGIKEY